MTTAQLYSVIRKAVDDAILENGDMIKIENDQIWWSNDGGHTWENCE